MDKLEIEELLEHLDNALDGGVSDVVAEQTVPPGAMSVTVTPASGKKWRGSTQKGSPAAPANTTARKDNQAHAHEIDALLNDLEFLDETSKTTKKAPIPAITTTAVNKLGLISTSDIKTTPKSRNNGINTNEARKSQSSLVLSKSTSFHCTQCDFEIVVFENAKWNQDVDYLFLRQTMPDRNKLKQKLENTSNARAFACQCKWVSIDTKDTNFQNIPSILSLRWIANASG